MTNQHASGLAVASFLILALSHAGSATAQETGDLVAIGSWRVIESKALGETRKLMISLPKGHKEGKQSAPVLYLLDARSNFAHTVGLVRLQEKLGNLPPVIVVGITNTKRARDLTPPSRSKDGRFPEKGGVESFLTFLRDEVFPVIEHDYRASSHRTLVGHSFGGLTALHSLVHHPADFAAYLAISPSLWWDQQALVAQAATAFAKDRKRAHRLFMTLGNEAGNMLGGYLKFQALLSEAAPAGLAWQARLLEDETHASVPYRSHLYGLPFLYHSWSNESLGASYLQGGWPAVQAHLTAVTAQYGTPRSFSMSTLVALGAQLQQADRHADYVKMLETAPESIMVPAAAFLSVAESAESAAKLKVARRAYAAALRLDPGAGVARAALVKLGVDPGTIAKQLTLSAKEQQAFVGTFVGKGARGAVVLKVVSKDAKLVAMIEGGPTMIMGPNGPDRFTMFEGVLRIQFTRNSARKVTQARFFAPDEEPVFLLRKE